MAQLLQLLGWGRRREPDPKPAVQLRPTSQTPTSQTPSHQPLSYQPSQTLAAGTTPSATSGGADEGAGAQELELTPWSVARLDAIATALIERPDHSALEAARSARTCLARLWLAAPVDGLETLFHGPIGQVYRKFLAGVLPALPLDSAETAWRASLSQYLMGGFERSGSLNVLLALLPYVDRHGLQVRDPFQALPNWLLPLYGERCDPAIANQLGTHHQGSAPVPLLEAAKPIRAGGGSDLPNVAPITGEASMALIGDAAFLGRASALINLYAIDPHDQEICRDLNRMRRQVAQVWLDVQASQMEALYRTPFGQLTDNLIGSNFANEPLDNDDITMRHQLAQVAADLRDPHALNALMAALLYYPIQQVKLPTRTDLLPPWLAQGLVRLGALSDGIPSTPANTPNQPAGVSTAGATGPAPRAQSQF